MDSILFYRKASVLEKYANFISRGTAYSSCFYWNESAVRKQECMFVVPTFLCPSVSLCLCWYSPIAWRLTWVLPTLFQNFKSLVWPPNEGNQEVPLCSLICDSRQVSAPKPIYLWAQEWKEIFISCVSRNQWPCFENTSGTMLISLRNGPAMAPTLDRARGSIGSVSTMYMPSSV